MKHQIAGSITWQRGRHEIWIIMNGLAGVRVPCRHVALSVRLAGMGFTLWPRDALFSRHRVSGILYYLPMYVLVIQYLRSVSPIESTLLCTLTTQKTDGPGSCSPMARISSQPAPPASASYGSTWASYIHNSSSSNRFPTAEGLVNSLRIPHHYDHHAPFDGPMLYIAGDMAYSYLVIPPRTHIHIRTR
jgi:hypothetical protein